MAAMTAEEIYANFHEKAAGTDSLEHAAGAAQRLADTLPDRAAQIERAAAKMRSFWKGSASEAAASGATPLSALLVSTGEDNGVAKSLSQSQATAFHKTKNAVQKVPPKPGVTDYMAASAMDPMGINPGAIAKVEDQAQQHKAISEANVNAYNEYHTTSDENGWLPEDTATLPQSAPAIHVARADGPAGGSAPAVPNVGGGAGGGGGGAGGYDGGGYGTTAPTMSGRSGGGSTLVPRVEGGGGSAGGGSGGGSAYSGGGLIGTGQTSTAGASGDGSGGAGTGPGGTGGRGGTGGEAGGPGGWGTGFGTGTGGSRRRGNPRTGEPVAGMPIGGGMGGMGADAGDIQRSGGGLGSGAGGQSAAGGSTAPGGGRSASGMEPSPGARSGAAAGAAAAEQQAVRTGAAAGSRGGAVGGPMGGGRGARGGEDAEHKSPHYLQENDPDSVFGTDEKTAPPVIGQ